MPSRLRTFGTLLLFVGNLLALSCSRPISEVPAGNPNAKRAPEPTLEHAQSVTPDPSQEWKKFDDPSRDGWSSEVFAEVACDRINGDGRS